MSRPDRRQFLQQGAAGVAVAWTTIHVSTARSAASRPLITGNDDYQYQFDHDWARLPDRYSWQTTHNVAVDDSGQVYVIHEGRRELPEHPAIFVFDPAGQFIRAFGQQFQGGGHGLEIRKEQGEEFLYVSAYQGLNCIAKLTLGGKLVWIRHAPMESGVYAADEAANAKKRGPAVWGRDRFMPTNFAFLPDGDFLVADGYGSWFIHRYDRDGNWKSCFAGPGDGPGKFDTPHGLWIDNRGESPTLVVTDRARHQLQYLSIDGTHVRTETGFGLPANADTRGDLLLVPELLGRITILDPDGKPLVRLGDDRQRIEADSEFEIRRSPQQWQAGKFVHPHDACFDRDGNILVAEWVAGGRIGKLTRI